MAQEQGDQPTAREESSRASSEPLEEEEETPQLMRTRSDAAGVIRRRPRHCAPGDAQRIWRHRFSINGHFYNHKTSVFTPAYGSVTNVRVNTTMTARHVLILLLNKFRVENGPSEFALYVVHESGERTKLKDSEYPLISRILHGPCEKIARIFLMEADLGEEVPHDVPGPAHDDAAASAAAGGDPVAHGHTEDQWAEADQGPPAGSPTSSRCLSTCLRTLSPVALALGPRAFTGPRARPRGQELTGWGLCVGLACTVSSPKVEALAILCDWMVWLFPFRRAVPDCSPGPGLSQHPAQGLPGAIAHSQHLCEPHGLGPHVMLPLRSSARRSRSCQQIWDSPCSQPSLSHGSPGMQASSVTR